MKRLLLINVLLVAIVLNVVAQKHYVQFKEDYKVNSLNIKKEEVLELKDIVGYYKINGKLNDEYIPSSSFTKIQGVLFTVVRFDGNSKPADSLCTISSQEINKWFEYVKQENNKVYFNKSDGQKYSVDFNKDKQNIDSVYKYQNTVLFSLGEKYYCIKLNNEDVYVPEVILKILSEDEAKELVKSEKKEDNSPKGFFPKISFFMKITTGIVAAIFIGGGVLIFKQRKKKRACKDIYYLYEFENDKWNKIDTPIESIKRFKNNAERDKNTVNEFTLAFVDKLDGTALKKNNEWHPVISYSSPDELRLTIPTIAIFKENGGKKQQPMWKICKYENHSWGIKNNETARSSEDIPAHNAITDGTIVYVKKTKKAYLKRTIQNTPEWCPVNCYSSFNDLKRVAAPKYAVVKENNQKNSKTENVQANIKEPILTIKTEEISPQMEMISIKKESQTQQTTESKNVAAFDGDILKYLSQEFKTQKAEINNIKNLINSIQQAQNSQNTEFGQLKKDIGILQKDLEGKINSSKEDLKGQIVLLGKDDAKNKRISELEKENLQKEQNIGELKNDKKKQEEKITQLGTDISNKDKEINDLTGKITTLKASSQLPTGVIKLSGYDSFVRNAADLFKIADSTEKEIAGYLNHLSQDDKAMVASFMSDYYTTRPVSDISEWIGIIAGLQINGLLKHSIKSSLQAETSEAKKIEILEKLFFDDIIRPYLSSLILFAERLRTAHYYGVQTTAPGTMPERIKELINIAKSMKADIWYFPMFATSSLDFKKIAIKEDKELSQKVKKTDGLDSNTIIDVKYYAVNCDSAVEKKTEVITYSV